MDIEFSSLKDLYNRIKPALKTKRLELKRSGIDYIKEEDIWNYLTEVKWVNSRNLSLYQMVSDVLNSENIKIDRYVKNKMTMRNRNLYFDKGGFYEEK